MQPLIINEDDDSLPKIVFDKEKNLLEMSGVSLPEDVVGFYKPVIQWIEDYLKDPNQETEVSVNLTYFNTSSSKAILDILTKFDELALKDLPVSVTWHYPEMDDDLLATGKEFKSMLKMPFNFVSYIQD